MGNTGLTGSSEQEVECVLNETEGDEKCLFVFLLGLQLQMI